MNNYKPGEIVYANKVKCIVIVYPYGVHEILTSIGNYDLSKIKKDSK